MRYNSLSPALPGCGGHLTTATFSVILAASHALTRIEMISDLIYIGSISLIQKNIQSTSFHSMPPPGIEKASICYSSTWFGCY